MAAPLQIASISQIVDPATRATFNDLIKVLNSPTGIGPGWVTSVTGSGNIASSGGTTPNITFTGILPTANGGTGIAYFTAAGPTVARTYTFPDADASIARIDAGQTFVGTQAFADGTFSGTLGVTGVATLGGNAFPTITGTNDQVLTTNGSGTLSWTDKAGGGGGGITALNSQTGATQTFTDDTNVTIVSGSDAHVITWAGTLAVARGGTGSASLGSTNTQVLFNDGGALAGDSGLVFNKTSNDLTVGGDLVVSGAGGHAFGAAASTQFQMVIGGAWSGTTNSQGLAISTAHTLPNSGGGYGMNIAPSFVKDGSGTHGIVTSAIFQPPTITGTGATVTNAASLYISNAPTGGTNNYALWIAAGNSRIAGGLTVTGGITNSALTAGRVTFAGTAGLLDDDAALTFNSGTVNLDIGTGSSVAGGIAITARNADTGANSNAGFAAEAVGAGTISFRAYSTGTAAPYASAAIIASGMTGNMFVMANTGTSLNLGNSSTPTSIVIAATGAVSIPGSLTVTGGIINAALTASKPVFSDGAKTLTSTGTVPVANGGTNLSSIANAAILVTNSANTLTALTATASQSIRRNASNTAWEAYAAATSPWTYTNSPASSSYNAFNIIADIDPTTDVVRIGDQTNGPITPAGTAQLSVINRWGGQAIIATSKTSDLSNTYIGTIPADARMSTSGAYLLTDNDSTEGGLSIGSYGAYIEARGSAGLTATLGVTWGAEISPQNLSGTASVPIPSDYFAGNGATIAALLLQAAGSSSGTTYDSSAALVIGANPPNGTKGDGFANHVSFNKGIVFLDSSISNGTSTDNGTGTMEAIALSANHQITWTAWNATTPVGRLTSDGTDLFWNGVKIN